ncbi:hypothetical protein N0V83_003686 [Neocucurbitaria cava]|uniref:Uncharacterized protein n=1 Tax=Neocucurbitaria cava TaxID=798079 RepID=A0A9W8YCQ7_9PLEO|nr:hypothetical protein N0V83_003686 [Neocucurbitaria cava]
MTTSSASSKQTTSFVVGTTMTSSRVGTTSTQKASSAPAPSSAPMDKFGGWRVQYTFWIRGNLAGTKWFLYDPNGNEAGRGGIHEGNYPNITDYIESKFRPEAQSMPFGVHAYVMDFKDADKARVRFAVEKDVPNCFDGHVSCRPSMATEDKTEEHPFEVESCFDKCAGTDLRPAMFWCNDLNDGMWLPENGGWRRTFWCGWKGF